jgi:hypothetical protein
MIHSSASTIFPLPAAPSENVSASRLLRQKSSGKKGERNKQAKKIDDIRYDLPHALSFKNGSRY